MHDAGYVTLLGSLAVSDPATTGVVFVVLKRATELVWITIGYGILALSTRSARDVSKALHEPEPP